MIKGLEHETKANHESVAFSIEWMTVALTVDCYIGPGYLSDWDKRAQNTSPLLVLGLFVALFSLHPVSEVVEAKRNRQRIPPG